MTVKRKCLFLSYTATLRAISLGQVTREELMGGLFYFGCAKSHARNSTSPPQEHDASDERTWFWKDNPQDRAAHLDMLMEALVEASKPYGRAIWRGERESNNFTELNLLLVGNGLPSLRESEDEFGITQSQYCYPEVARRIKNQGIDLHVVR